MGNSTPGQIVEVENDFQSEPNEMPDFSVVEESIGISIFSDEDFVQRHVSCNTALFYCLVI